MMRVSDIKVGDTLVIEGFYVFQKFGFGDCLHSGGLQLVVKSIGLQMIKFEGKDGLITRRVGENRAFVRAVKFREVPSDNVGQAGR
jgi:hypothetical protein